MQPPAQAREYDKLADHWNSELFNRLNGIEQHKRALRYVASGRHALDVGCGSSGRIIELMLNSGLRAEGLDLSENMLRLAKLRHPNTCFHHADIVTWQPAHQYDFISAWDSIWHVPLAHQSLVFSKLFDALAPHGTIIFSSGAVDTPGEGENQFKGHKLYHAALGVPAILALMTKHHCICRHLENDDWPERHLTVIAQKSVTSS